MKKCVFCESTENLTKEHVLPKWLQKSINGSTRTNFKGVHLSFIGQSLSERNGSGNTLVFSEVCAECNNGWMSRLENDVKPILQRLSFEQNPKKISRHDRKLVATWVIKTAMMIHFSSNYRTILPRSLAKNLRPDANIPSGIKVYLGNKKSINELSWIQGSFNFGVIRTEDQYNMDMMNRTFQCSLLIDNIFLRMCWHSYASNKYTTELINNNDAELYPHPIPAKIKSIHEDIHSIGMNVSLKSKTN